MITIILTLALQIASNQEQTIQANKACENKPNIQYYIESGLICLPTDIIYRGDFE